MLDTIKSRFIVSNKNSKERIEELAERAIMHGQVTEDGKFIIKNKALSQDNKVKLCLVLKKIANAFVSEIPAEIRPSDLTTVIGERVESVGSRLSQLASSDFARKPEYGKYLVNDYVIESFLNDLDSIPPNEEGSRITQKRTRTKISGSRKEKALTGVGLDIQNLLDKGFFKTPHFVSEVEVALKTETKYHDIRVIDATLRKTFVSGRRTLKRIPNIEGGKAKWKYVVR